ncbi:hypothetical protein J6590_060162 [Homalodisca vitripennis]|nr:hypothetical protein J6590_060162 [Homalodisca vitripennis]
MPEDTPLFKYDPISSHQKALFNTLSECSAVSNGACLIYSATSLRRISENIAVIRHAEAASHLGKLMVYSSKKKRHQSILMLKKRKVAWHRNGIQS